MPSDAMTYIIQHWDEVGAHLETTWLVTMEEMLLVAAGQKSGLLGTFPPVGWPPARNYSHYLEAV